MKTDRQRIFLSLLASICKDYSAEFSYTHEDDGIHIFAEGDEVFVGYLDDKESVSKQLIEATLND